MRILMTYLSNTLLTTLFRGSSLCLFAFPLLVLVSIEKTFPADSILQTLTGMPLDSGYPEAFSIGLLNQFLSIISEDLSLENLADTMYNNGLIVDLYELEGLLGALLDPQHWDDLKLVCPKYDLEVLRQFYSLTYPEMEIPFTAYTSSSGSGSEIALESAGSEGGDIEDGEIAFEPEQGKDESGSGSGNDSSGSESDPDTNLNPDGGDGSPFLLKVAFLCGLVVGFTVVYSCFGSMLV